MNKVRLRKKQIQQLEKMEEVLAIYLFGSRAQGISHPLADYDYGVLTKFGGHRRGDALHDELYEILSEISPRNLENDVIDIIFLRDIGLELRFHVIRYGVLIYDRDPSSRLEFETRTNLLYCDFRPLLDYQDRTILEAL